MEVYPYYLIVKTDESPWTYINVKRILGFGPYEDGTMVIFDIKVEGGNLAMHVHHHPDEVERWIDNAIKRGELLKESNSLKPDTEKETDND